jgi:hypothetical protein
MTKEERKEATKQTKQAKKDAIDTLVNFVKDNFEEVPENVDSALSMLSKKPGTRRVSVSGAVIETIKKEKVINEVELFTQYKLGRTEVRALLNRQLNADIENRIWVSFNPETGNYTVEGTGVKAPKDWSGYTPKDLQEENLDKEMEKEPSGNMDFVD